MTGSLWLLLSALALAEGPPQDPLPVDSAPTAVPEVIEAAPTIIDATPEPTVLDRITLLEAEIAALRAERGASAEAAPAAGHGVASGSVTQAGLVVVPHGVIWEEAVAFGGDVVVHGKVRGAATAFGGDVRVMEGGIVEGDAVAFGGRVQVQPGGIVGGNQIGTSGQEAASAESSALGDALSWAYDRLVALLTIGGTGVLVVALFPGRVNKVAQRLEARPLRSFFLGAFGGISVATAAILFAITLLGLPVSVALLGGLAFGGLLGFVGLSQAVGDRLPMRRQEHGRWLAFLAGCLIVGFFSSLPLLGALFAGAAGAAGLGAALSSRFGTR